MNWFSEHFGEIATLTVVLAGVAFIVAAVAHAVGG